MSSVHASTIPTPPQTSLTQTSADLRPDARMSSSAQLSHPKAIRLIYDLTAQLKDKAAHVG